MYIQVAYIRWRLESGQDLNFKNGIQTKVELWPLMKKNPYFHTNKNWSQSNKVKLIQTNIYQRKKKSESINRTLAIIRCCLYIFSSFFHCGL